MNYWTTTRYPNLRIVDRLRVAEVEKIVVKVKLVARQVEGFWPELHIRPDLVPALRPMLPTQKTPSPLGWKNRGCFS
jgi:hypothetical protein